MLCNIVRRARAHTVQITLGLVAATLTFALFVALATPSQAALIGTYSLRLDGFVKQGVNVGEEGHFAANLDYLDNFPVKQLPANVDPPAPLLNARDLQVTETEATQRIIISITNNTNDAKLGTIFANPLNPAVPVEWEANFAWTNVPAGQKVNITNIDYIVIDETTLLEPVTQTISGVGTEASPLKVLLTLNPAQMRVNPNSGLVEGPFKVFLDYNFMNVPEPTSALLGLMGIAGVVGLGRRRS